jgi:hypothetical protein
MELTDKYYKLILECASRTNIMMELSYKGNIGLAETMMFYRIATDEQKKRFDYLVSTELNKAQMSGEDPNFIEAWEFLQQVTGFKLHGLPQKA